MIIFKKKIFCSDPMSGMDNGAYYFPIGWSKKKYYLLKHNLLLKYSTIRDIP